MNTDHITHLSFSSLWLYMTDREEWCRRYIDGKSFEPTEAMEMGTRLHNDIEMFLINTPHYQPVSPYFPYWKEWYDKQSFVTMKPEHEVYRKVGNTQVLGYMDLVTEDTVYDWKLVQSFTTSFSLRYYLQACTYSFLTGHERVVFVEVKKAKGRDGVQVHEIEMVIPQEHRDFIERLFLYMWYDLHELLTPSCWDDPFYIKDALNYYTLS